VPGGTQRPGGYSLRSEKGDTTSTAERPADGDDFAFLSGRSAERGYESGSSAGYMTRMSAFRMSRPGVLSPSILTMSLS
jgi:hypothetical protein